MSHVACVKKVCRCGRDACVERSQREVLGAYEWARPEPQEGDDKPRAPFKESLAWYLTTWTKEWAPMVIFLGFDGVLNGRTTHDEPSPFHPALRLNRRMVARLNMLVSRTGAQVVLTTSWRTRLDVSTLRRALAHVGFTGDIIGATPALASWPQTHTPRSDEIRAWLKANTVGAFVTLDDHGDADVDGRGVRTDVRVGLTAEDVERATMVLCKTPWGKP